MAAVYLYVYPGILLCLVAAIKLELEQSKDMAGSCNSRHPSLGVAGAVEWKSDLTTVFIHHILVKLQFA